MSLRASVIGNAKRTADAGKVNILDCLRDEVKPEPVRRALFLGMLVVETMP